MSRQSALSLVVIVLLLAGGGIGLLIAWQTPTEPAAGTQLIGEARPDFRLATLNGEWLEAADLDGKLTLLNFWATWCGPCREEMPLLNETHQQYSDQGFQVVGVAMDDAGKVQQFYQQLNISYPTAVGASDVLQTIKNYGNAAGNLPYSVLIGRDGRVLWRKLGELHAGELESLMTEHL